jgi:hypothetical protein
LADHKHAVLYHGIRLRIDKLHDAAVWWLAGCAMLVWAAPCFGLAMAIWRV